MSEALQTQFVYFDVAHAVGVHDWIIKTSGGVAGIKDLGALESVVEHVQNDFYYPTFQDKLTHIVFSITKLHAFTDGNKRSSLALGAYFLTINGYDFCIKEFMLYMENIVVWVAENKISKSLLQKLISSIISLEDYSENLKLELFEAINNDDYR